MAKRKTSESVKKMRLIILGLSVALIAAVVLATWFTLSRESENGEISWKVASTTTTTQKIAGEPDETTTVAASNAGSDTQTTTNADGLPYDKGGSDLYANWNGKYQSAEVVIKRADNGRWSAFVKDKKVPDCTGVYCNEFGWWFIRNGEVDYNYTGIAGNEKGMWYVENGRCDFNKNGTFTPFGSNTHYTIIEGKVERINN